MTSCRPTGPGVSRPGAVSLAGRVRFATAVLALALFASAVRAEITPEAAAVVARYLEASGGRAAFAADSVLYLRARVEAFGFTGSVETWTARPDRRYTRTALGPFALEEGTEGVRAWRTDPTTGVVRVLADHDLDDALASTWFELERWAEPDQGGGRVTVVARERDARGAITVLEVTPPDLAGRGAAPRPRRLAFHDTDGLPVRSVARDDQREVSTLFTAPRRVAGRVRSGTSETVMAGMAANRMRATLDSVAVSPSLTGVRFALDAVPASTNDVRWLGPVGVARFPCDYRARHLWVKVRVNGGAPEDFLFDTGASVTVLDSAWAAERGLRTAGRMQAAGAGAAGGASFATLDSLQWTNPDGHGIALTGVRVGVLDVNGAFAPVFWRRLAGVLGYDVLGRFVVVVDYDARTIELHDPATWRPSTTEPALPMVMNGTVPALTGRLDGEAEGLFRLDLGSSGTVDVHTPFAREHGLEGRMRRTLRTEGVGFGGTFSSVVGRLARMALGPYEWDDPIVSLAEAEEGAFASEEFAGNIGNRVLERFRVTLDYAGRRVFLEPGRRYAERDHLTRTGALFVRTDGVVRVGGTLPGSAGDRAGLLAGDEVVAIEDRPIADWDLGTVSALLDDGEPGRRVVITVRRGGRERVVRVRLADVLP